MEARKIRFGMLLAAAVILPSTGYLVGFTKAQSGQGDDWSDELAVNHKLLSPDLLGVAAMQHGEDLKLTEAEKAKILKLVRADAPALIQAQEEDWNDDVRIAQNIMSGDEIVMEFSTAASLRKVESRPYGLRETEHLSRVEQIIDKTRWPILFKLRAQAQAAKRKTQLFTLYDPANEKTLRLSERQKRQLVRLASYQAMVTTEKNLYGYDRDYKTIPMKDSLAVLRTASAEQMMYFSMQADDFLDPLQQLQLRALVRDRLYVPVP